MTKDWVKYQKATEFLEQILDLYKYKGRLRFYVSKLIYVTISI